MRVGGSTTECVSSLWLTKPLSEPASCIVNRAHKITPSPPAKAIGPDRAGDVGLKYPKLHRRKFLVAVDVSVDTAIVTSHVRRSQTKFTCLSRGNQDAGRVFHLSKA
jgi:hypothetical protein